MPIIDHFGLAADAYDRVAKEKDPGPLAGYLGLPRTGVLLDAGGGTGRAGQALNGMVDRVVVADVSMGMLRVAAGKPGLAVVCSETEGLPFASRTFDSIVMVDALHHVRDQARTTAELWRVLAPGGCLVIEEPDIRAFAVKLIALVEKLLLMRSRMRSPEVFAGFFAGFPEAEVHVFRERYAAYIQVFKKGERNA